MPLWKCTSCHHEWEGRTEICDWCFGDGEVLQERTSLERTVDDTKITRSCGCILCDIGLQPTKMRRQYVHYDRRHGIVVCPVSGIKRSAT